MPLPDNTHLDHKSCVLMDLLIWNVVQVYPISQLVSTEESIKVNKIKMDYQTNPEALCLLFTVALAY